MAKRVLGDLVIFDAAAQMEGIDRPNKQPREAPTYRAHGTFTAAATDIVTMADHGFIDRTAEVVGGPFRVTTSAADLPAGLTAGIDYWFRTIDQDTFYIYTTEKLAQDESLIKNSNGDNALDITDAGTGTHTLNMPNHYQFPMYVQQFKVDTGDGGAFLLTYVADAGSRLLKLDNTPADDTLWVPIYQRVKSVYVQTLPTNATVEMYLGED